MARADHAAQEAASLTAPEWQRRANAIRQTLTAAHVKADDRRARFVTVAAYVGAGGRIIADLFQTGSEGYLTDPALLDRLMSESSNARPKPCGRKAGNGLRSCPIPTRWTVSGK